MKKLMNTLAARRLTRWERRAWSSCDMCGRLQRLGQRGGREERQALVQPIRVILGCETARLQRFCRLRGEQEVEMISFDCRLHCKSSIWCKRLWLYDAKSGQMSMFDDLLTIFRIEEEFNKKEKTSW